MAQPVQNNAIYDAVELLKDKTVKTRLGALPLKVPQTRDCEFYPQSLEKGLRSERALLLSIAEMCMCRELDELLADWRERELGAYRYKAKAPTLATHSDVGRRSATSGIYGIQPA